MAFEQWIAKLQALKPDKQAPHKPLLLLTILKAVERDGTLPEVLRLSPELVYEFKQFEHIVTHRRSQKLDIRMPFHHLKTSGVWTPMDKYGEKSENRAVTTHVVFDPNFRAACLDSVFRQGAMHLLITSYFEPLEQIALREILGLSNEIEIDSTQQPTPEQLAATQGRSTRFRLDVVPAYNYTCTLTGYRITTVERGTIVDAAHIDPFRSSKNDDVRNGLALCKNAHWAFDVGLWSLDDECCVLVAADVFDEDSPDQTPLKQMVGRKIRLPRNPNYWPLPANLAAHRKLHRF